MLRGYRVNYNLATVNFSLQAELAEQGIIRGSSLIEGDQTNDPNGDPNDPNNPINKYQHKCYRIATSGNQKGEFINNVNNVNFGLLPGAVIGGAIGAVTGDKDQSLTDRAVRGLSGAAIGGVAGKLGSNYLGDAVENLGEDKGKGIGETIGNIAKGTGKVIDNISHNPIAEIITLKATGLASIFGSLYGLKKLKEIYADIPKDPFTDMISSSIKSGIKASKANKLDQNKLEEFQNLLNSVPHGVAKTSREYRDYLNNARSIFDKFKKDNNIQSNPQLGHIFNEHIQGFLPSYEPSQYAKGYRNYSIANFSLINKEVTEDILNGALTGAALGSAKYLLSDDKKDKDLGKAFKDIGIGAIVGGSAKGIAKKATKKIIEYLPEDKVNIGKEILDDIRNKSKEISNEVSKYRPVVEDIAKDINSSVRKGYRTAKYYINEARIKSYNLLTNPDIREKTDNPELLNTVTDPALYEKGLNSPRELVKIAKEILT
jgi:gas vesicle protein